MFPASKRLRFEYTKRIMSTKMRPKSFGTFENGALPRLFFDTHLNLYDTSYPKTTVMVSSFLSSDISLFLPLIK